MTSPPPVWLRGPVPGIAPALQPVAHALMQVAEETPVILATLSPEQIWARPGGAASIGFHVAHLAGSLDRLFTYSRGEHLSSDQQAALAAERTIDTTRPSVPEILRLLSRTVDAALQHLRTVPPSVTLRTAGGGEGATAVHDARPAFSRGRAFHPAWGADHYHGARGSRCHLVPLRDCRAHTDAGWS